MLDHLRLRYFEGPIFEVMVNTCLASCARLLVSSAALLLHSLHGGTCGVYGVQSIDA